MSVVNTGPQAFAAFMGVTISIAFSSKHHMTRPRSSLRHSEGWRRDYGDGSEKTEPHHEESDSDSHGWYPRDLRDDRECAAHQEQ